jgi:hypothetical protein
MSLFALSGSGEAFNFGQFLEETSPYAWGMVGIGLCIGLSVLGAGWYCSIYVPTLWRGRLLWIPQGDICDWFFYSGCRCAGATNIHEKSHQVCAQAPSFHRCRIKLAYYTVSFSAKLSPYTVLYASMPVCVTPFSRSYWAGVDHGYRVRTKGGIRPHRASLHPQ